MDLDKTAMKQTIETRYKKKFQLNSKETRQ